jgi:hypothetical protein
MIFFAHLFLCVLLIYFQNRRAKGYEDRDFAFLCEKPSLKKEGVLEDETDDDETRHERFFLGKITMGPKMTRKWNVAVEVNRLRPVFVKGKWEWEVAAPPITDQISCEKAVVGMIIPDKVDYVSRTKSRYVIDWLNPSAIACFPLQK